MTTETKTTMSVSDLAERLARGERLQLIDVRSPQEYHEAHVPCALNIPLEQIEGRMGDLHASAPIVAICQSGKRAEMAAPILAQAGCPVLVLEGGTSAWLSEGLDGVGNTAAKLPLMRQVQLVVGPMALIGSALALTVNPLWAILPAFIGLGLTVAGSTGFCGMGVMLSKMPWNKPKSNSEACPTPNLNGKV